VWEHTYLLWFGDDLTHIWKLTKPPGRRRLALAVWASGAKELDCGMARSGPTFAPIDFPNRGRIDGPRGCCFWRLLKTFHRLMLQKLGRFRRA